VNREHAELALSAYLEGRGELPEPLAFAAGPELELLKKLCGGRHARALVAAHALAEALFPPRPEPPAPPSAASPAPMTSADAIPIGSVESALEEAHGEVLRLLALEEDVARLAPWIGVGWYREGSALERVVHDRLDELERLLARAPALHRIADLVGKLEASAKRGRGAERGGRETVVGVTTGGELADVLPSELALLGTPETEDLFLMRLAERRLLSLELEGEHEGDPREPKRRGPALIAVDTSGSMIGPTEELGKAATLVLVRRILGEGRRAEVAIFGGKGSIKTLAFRPGQPSLQALFDLLMTSYHGGTDFDGPISWALSRRQEPSMRRADVVMVSDGRGRLHPGTTRRLEAAQKARTHPLSLIFVRIGPGDSPSGPGRARFDPFLELADEIARVSQDGTLQVSAAASRP
jgi:uncharacterized protein with von Willebrand factor type A (vWA) domain